MIVDNERNEFQITDFAVPYDTKKYLKRTEESVEYESESSSRSNWSSENTFSSTREKNADLALRQGLLSYENNFLLYTGRTLRKILEMWDVLLTPYLKNEVYLLKVFNMWPFSNKNNEIKDYYNNIKSNLGESSSFSPSLKRKRKRGFINVLGPIVFMNLSWDQSFHLKKMIMKNINL